jgi:DNA-binding transcriptional LysR family regulator
MDIDALKTFLEVNRTRHFGQAADNLYLSQSAVSARIRLLEEEVGMPLFTRQRNNIELTPAGKKLLNYAENILVTWHRAKQEIGASEEKRVPMVMGCMPSLWEILLLDLVQHLHQSLPGLVLHTESQNYDVLIRRIKEGSFDLAFCFDYPQLPDLEVIEVMNIPLVMVSSTPGLGVTEALSKDYILVDWGSAFAMAHAKYFPDMPAPFMRVSIGRMAKDVLLSQGGTAYLAEPMIRQEISANKLHKVKDAPVITRNAYIAYSPSSDKSETIAHVLNYFDVKQKTVQPGVAAAERV